MNSLGIVTTSRADYSYYRPLMQLIQSSNNFELKLFVTGTHKSSNFGNTIETIQDDSFQITDTVQTQLTTETNSGTASYMGRITDAFASVYDEYKIDLLFVLGDRHEMFAAASAAIPFGFPIAHIAGGALSLGAIDDSFRHAITKLSHLHFVEISRYAKRVKQLGEEDWRINVIGALSLENVPDSTALPTLSDLIDKYNWNFSEPPLLITYHPETLSNPESTNQFQILLDSLDEIGAPKLFTYPGADPESHAIIQSLENYVLDNKDSESVKSLGVYDYYGIVNESKIMVGNSSSGIVEAATFNCPVVNIGIRQKGRHKPENVVTVPHDRRKIIEAIKEVEDTDVESISNPYKKPSPSESILEMLEELIQKEELLQKKFVDHL